MTIMNCKSYLFHIDFINVINGIIINTNLDSKYKLNNNNRYTIEYLLEIIIKSSSKLYSRFKLHKDLCTYIKVHEHNRYSITGIKYIIKNQTTNIDHNFVNKYVVIGYDIPFNITELNVVL